jgi:hypothetical protein
MIIFEIKELWRNKESQRSTGRLHIVIKPFNTSIKHGIGNIKHGIGNAMLCFICIKHWFTVVFQKGSTRFLTINS